MVTGAPMSILKSCEEAGAETAGSCVPLKHVAEMPAIMLQGAESASPAASMRLPGVTVKLPMKSPSAGGSFLSAQTYQASHVLYTVWIKVLGVPCSKLSGAHSKDNDNP